jgi:hypothetical protein
MKYLKLLLSFFALNMCIILTIQTKEGGKQNLNANASVQKMVIFNQAAFQTNSNTNLTDDLAQIILGKWEVAENERRLSGYIIFNENGNYEMLEEMTDGTKVTKAGEYILNTNKSPATIDLCLGQCKQEGSEWTTLFGIVRSIPGGKLEINISSDGNYPTDFPDDKSNSGTMILSRM